MSSYLEKVFFELYCHRGEVFGYEDLIKFFQSPEEAEHILGIEFAGGFEINLENQEIKSYFFSDYVNQENEDEYLDKYDGHVEARFIRKKKTAVAYDLNDYVCEISLVYNSEYQERGPDEFSKIKVVFKKMR